MRMDELRRKHSSMFVEIIANTQRIDSVHFSSHVR
jgi:hypothetical protein